MEREWDFAFCLLLWSLFSSQCNFSTFQIFLIFPQGFLSFLQLFQFAGINYLSISHVAVDKLAMAELCLNIACSMCLRKLKIFMRDICLFEKGKFFPQRRFFIPSHFFSILKLNMKFLLSQGYSCCRGAPKLVCTEKEDTRQIQGMYERFPVVLYRIIES